MIEFAINPNPMTPEEDLAYLSLQIAVGKIIRENPQLTEFFNHQHKVLLNKVVSTGLVTESHSYHLLQAQHVSQIRVYEFLGTMDDKLEQNIAAHREQLNFIESQRNNPEGN